MTFTLVDMTGHTAFALTALSFYVRDILVLRGVAVVGGMVLSTFFTLLLIPFLLASR